MIKKINIFIIIFVLLNFLQAAYAQPEYQAKVQNLSQDKYFQATLDAINKASKSITCVMYLISLNSQDTNSKIYQLSQALVNAKDRGVKVQVYLDQNIDFTEETSRQDWEVKGKNVDIYGFLKDKGITVYFDGTTRYTHAKAIVIDNETVILGSTNWTLSALSKNFETNALIRSRDFANEIIKEIQTIPTQEAQVAFHPYIPISNTFLTDKHFLGRMVTTQDERALDIYLLLLKEYNGNPQAKVILDHDKTAQELKLSGTMDRTAYRRQITKVLDKLQSRYNLITYQPQFGKDVTVFLKSYSNPKAPYLAPTENYIKLASPYWDYNWDNKLSLTAKACYLINIAKAGTSDKNPWWFASRGKLSEEYNLSPWSISKGMQELRHLNIINVEYPPLPIPGQTQRTQAKRYKFQGLYDPDKLKEQLEALEDSYGKDKLTQAKTYAQIVAKENDPDALGAIIELIETYPTKTLDQIADELKAKNIDNPKRSLAYFIGAVKKSDKKGR